MAGPKTFKTEDLPRAQALRLMQMCIAAMRDAARNEGRPVSPLEQKNIDTINERIDAINLRAELN